MSKEIIRWIREQLFLFKRFSMWIIVAVNEDPWICKKSLKTSNRTLYRWLSSDTTSDPNFGSVSSSGAQLWDIVAVFHLFEYLAASNPSRRRVQRFVFYTEGLTLASSQPIQPDQNFHLSIASACFQQLCFLHSLLFQRTIQREDLELSPVALRAKFTKCLNYEWIVNDEW